MTAKPVADDPADSSGLGCAALLACVCAAAGVGTAILLVSSTANWFAARSWVKADCVLKSAELVSDDGNYSIEATYKYRFDGKPFTSRRVSFYGGSDSVGPFHHRKYRELNKAMKQGGVFHCFVDPDDPSTSVLFRDFRPRMFVFLSAFPLTFGVIGIAGLFWCLCQRKRLRFLSAMRTALPDEPWTWRADWHAGIIKPVKQGLIRQSIGVVVLNGFAWPLTILFLPNVFGVVGLALCLFAIVSAWHTLRYVRSFLRLRDARLHLDEATGVRGTGISGRIFLPVETQPDSGFLVSLTVVHRLKREDKDGGNVQTEAARGQWQQRVLATKCEDGMEVVFRFRISNRYSEVNDSKPIIWTIDLLASPPHVGCDLHFEVPVFSVPGSTWQLPNKLAADQIRAVTFSECFKRNRGSVLREGPEKYIVELRSPKKWYGGEGPAYRLEYDRESVSMSGGETVPLSLATTDMKKIGRRLGGYGKFGTKMPFGFFRERYEVEVKMSDGKQHTLASFDRLADAKALVRSMRQITGVSRKQ